jgi:CheY-like chemotaxis protein/anti-sigma regulatory factor (Ser/Thr protein kinase)
MGCGPEVREVLTNLIFNACDAMPQGGVIVLRTRDDDGEVRIEVSDTGTGMTTEQLARCLEPFYSTKGERGTGLGLSVAYGIIHRHSGRIEIQSELGKGTTFSLVLPATTAAASTADVVVTNTGTRPLRVLVVDDQEIICELISEQLRTDGHEASTVFDGLQALAALKENSFDVLITDQSMPGMNGEQLAKECKRLYPTMPIILLTGFGEEMKAAGTLPEGIMMIIPKPVSGADLRKAIFEVSGQAA